MDVSVYTQANTHAHLHACKHTCTHLCKCACAHTCVCVCVCACVWACVCCMHAHACMCTHTQLVWWTCLNVLLCGSRTNQSTIMDLSIYPCYVAVEPTYQDHGCVRVRYSYFLYLRIHACYFSLWQIYIYR